MIRLIFNLLIALLFASSCTSNQTDSESAETAKESPEMTIEEEDSKVDTIIKTFQIEPLKDINNTSWIYKPYPNCIDTLTFNNGQGSYYQCEHELDEDIVYDIKFDTLYIDRYGYISEVNADLGKEVKSKYKLIKSEDKLITVGIAHKYDSTFSPVDEQYLYHEFVKN